MREIEYIDIGNDSVAPKVCDFTAFNFLCLLIL